MVWWTEEEWRVGIPAARRAVFGLLLVGGWFPFAHYDFPLPRLRTQVYKSLPPSQKLVLLCHCCAKEPLPHWGGAGWNLMGEKEQSKEARRIRLVLHRPHWGPCWVLVYVPTQRFSFLQTKPICKQPSWSAPLRFLIQYRTVLQKSKQRIS